MMNEMKFNVEKSDEEKDLQDFKIFKTEVKALLKTGKLKIVEKYRVFAFIIIDPSADERKNITSFLKDKHIALELVA